MKRREFMEATLASAAIASSLGALTPMLSTRVLAADSTESPSLSIMKNGQLEKATVPDTLDLADRARLAINALTGTLDPDHNYEVYQLCVPGGDYPYFTHETTGLPTLNPKYAEALPMMRVMSGSEQNLEAQNKMMKMMLSRIEPPGLYFVPPATETFRPWALPKFGGSAEWTANVYGNARLMLACMAWHQYTGDPVWKRVIETLNEGLMKVAVYKDDYAYYPDGAKGGEPFSYPKSGWAITTEPTRDDQVGGESLFMYTGGQARAMARWAAMSGNEKSLDLSRRICKFMMKPKYWGLGCWGKRKDIPEETDPVNVAGADRGLWRGHTCGRLEALRGLIEYAIVADDARTKEFVRAAYEWMRNYGFAKVGHFSVILGAPWGGDSCILSRAVALAIKLTESGIGDYWEDVDQWTRNGLVDWQTLPETFSEAQMALSASAPEIPDGVQVLGPGPGVGGARHVPGCYTTDHVLARYIGGFGHACCNSNGSTGLYYAWEGAVRFRDPAATVNLLLNRVSPWVNIESFLPYEGKVIIKNKKAKRLFARIPAWVREREVHCRINNAEAAPSWAGRYLVFEDLRPGTEVTIIFPMVTETAHYTVDGKSYACTFKGNTLVNMEPDAFGLRLPSRELEYKKDKAPMKEASRYVAPMVLKW